MEFVPCMSLLPAEHKMTWSLLLFVFTLHWTHVFFGSPLNCFPCLRIFTTFHRVEKWWNLNLNKPNGYSKQPNAPQAIKDANILEQNDRCFPVIIENLSPLTGNDILHNHVSLQTILSASHQVGVLLSISAVWY